MRIHRDTSRILAPAALLLVATTVPAGTPPPGFTETVYASIGAPTALAFNPLTGDLWMCNRGFGGPNNNAQVRVRNATTGLVTTALTLTGVDSTGERGLLGIAFDPEFATNHFVYLYYTAHDTVVVNCNPQAHNRVARFVESGGTLSGQTNLLEGPPLTCANNHNGGDIHFGPDGKLYIAMGDNNTGGEPLPAAQNLNDLRGKMLRISRDGSIPPDNPFYGQAGVRWEIWAWGLRNPWRFSVKPGTGELFIADVGQVAQEEVDLGVPGANYGWPAVEGSAPPGVAGMTYPIYTYNHASGTPTGCAITGGPVYGGTAFPPDFRGNYYFADYCQGWIYRAHLDAANAITSVEPFLTGGVAPVHIVEGPDGCLYYSSFSGGVVYRECYTGGSNGQPTAVASGTPTSGLAPLDVAFSSAGSGDPDGQGLAYLWSFGDGTPMSTLPHPPHTYGVNGVYSAVLTVDDGQGAGNSTDASPPVRVVVGNRAPTATITTPAPGTRYDAGDTINYAGIGTDPEDGSLAASAFTWTVTFHHDTHVHPFIGPIGGQTSGSFTIPTSGEPSADTWFEIALSVQDSGSPLGSSGRLTSTTSTTIEPNTVEVTLDTLPPGLQLVRDGQPVTAPDVTERVVRFPWGHGVTTPQTIGGLPYTFAAWSDGGAASHTVVTPDVDTTYRARFHCDPPSTAQELRVAKGAGNMLDLSWTAATTPCHGGQWRVYAASSPVPASPPGFFPLDPSYTVVATASGTTASIAAPAPLQFYVVVSVDANGHDGPP